MKKMAGPFEIHAIKTDITTLQFDAIVNAANKYLSGSEGLGGTIHHAVRSKLLEVYRPIGGCPNGKARITPGFNLQTKYVIHTLGTLLPGWIFVRTWIACILLTKLSESGFGVPNLIHQFSL